MASSDLTFRLRIALGNDAMQDEHDIAGALRRLADYLDESMPLCGRPIIDANGNTVGEWDWQS